MKDDTPRSGSGVFALTKQSNVLKVSYDSMNSYPHEMWPLVAHMVSILTDDVGATHYLRTLFGVPFSFLVPRSFREPFISWRCLNV